MTDPLGEELAGTESNRLPDSQSGSRLTGWRKELSALARTAVVAAAVVLILNKFVVNLSIVEGSSMRPTLVEGDWLLVSRLAGSVLPVERNDVVIIRDPEPLSGSTGYLVKRIIGLPGDTVELKEGNLVRNGLQVVEPYAYHIAEEESFRAVTVEPGHLFVLGDNRQRRASRDSRAFGTIDESAVTGRAELVLWPMQRLGWL
ncbi:signal peptidase I [Paenibacillus pasadenensis]|uniref:signal peptidase I n=1 Tax=Paenibacillus pasadenensis TaxID=217090 RepID=UPI00203FDF5B|nr:signal peptidase I [Paenibacillus pasadenensis]MCM3748439.1 signal peptidase I [Paenibacillus pasadenensis]